MTPGASGPHDPVTPLAEAASSMHELYTALRDAGFTDKQAFDLMKEVAKGIVTGMGK